MVTKIVGIDSCKHTCRAAKKDIVLCLQIPNHLLHSWYCDHDVDADYIDLANKSIDHGAIKITSSATRLHAKVRYIGGEYKRKKRSDYLMKYSHFDVRSNEINVSPFCLILQPNLPVY